MSAKLKEKKDAAIARGISDDSDEGITWGSGNVFADMGEPDADVLHFKARLICEIQRVIDERGLTQTEAAAITGMDQPTVSKLLRGRHFKVSTDRLFAMLNRLGCDVVVSVEAPATPVRRKRTATTATPTPTMGRVWLAAST